MNYGLCSLKKLMLNYSVFPLLLYVIGSYHAILNGDAANALFDLTGMPIFKIPIDEQNLGNKRK